MDHSNEAARLLAEAAALENTPAESSGNAVIDGARGTARREKSARLAVRAQAHATLAMRDELANVFNAWLYRQ